MHGVVKSRRKTQEADGQCHIAVQSVACYRACDLLVQGLPVHLDGARVFNAAVALGVHVSAIADLVTSVQFCLSKVCAVEEPCQRIRANACRCGGRHSSTNRSKL